MKSLLFVFSHESLSSLSPWLACRPIDANPSEPIRAFRFGLVLVALLAFGVPLVARAETNHAGVSAVDAWFTVTTSDVPTPANCEVNPSDALNGLVVAPNLSTPIPASVNDIYVRNSANNPMPSVGVEVRFGDALVYCSDAVFTGITDSNGYVQITLSGGGCLESEPFAGWIKANGVTIRAYDNVNSPDFDGGGGDLVVDLADLIAFSGEFLQGGDGCHDYDDNEKTDLGDLIIFSQAFVDRYNCP